jgi:hypothetical protein
MSKRLYAVIKFDKNSSIENISEKCFNIVAEACKRKIAVNQLYYHDYIDRFWFEREVILGKNTIMLELSNSYVFCLAEEFLLNDISIPKIPHIKRLDNLCGLFKFIFSLPKVEYINVYMSSDYYEEKDFETINCSFEDFASIMVEKLKSTLSYAYKCVFSKKEVKGN